MSSIYLASIEYLKEIAKKHNSVWGFIAECSQIGRENGKRNNQGKSTLLLPYLLIIQTCFSNQAWSRDFLVSTGNQSGAFYHLFKIFCYNAEQRFGYGNLPPHIIDRITTKAEDLRRILRYVTLSSKNEFREKLFHEIWSVVNQFCHDKSADIALREEWASKDAYYFHFSGYPPRESTTPEEFWVCRMRFVDELASSYKGKILEKQKESLQNHIAELRKFLNSCLNYHKNKNIPDKFKNSTITHHLFVAYCVLEYWPKAFMHDSEQCRDGKGDNSYLLMEAIIDQVIGVSLHGIQYLENRDKFACPLSTPSSLFINSMRFSALLATNTGLSPRNIFAELWSGIQLLVIEYVDPYDEEHLQCLVNNDPASFVYENTNNINVFGAFFGWMRAEDIEDIVLKSQHENIIAEKKHHKLKIFLRNNCNPLYKIVKLLLSYL